MFRSGVRLAVSILLITGSAAFGMASSSAADPGGTVGIEKSVVGLTGPAAPGDSFQYQLTASCSSLTVACVGASVTDVLPAGLTVTDLPATNRNQTVTFDPTTRRFTLTYTQPLPPPNPVGSTGLPAGSVSKILISVQLPTNTTAPDGSTITNTATITATNSPPATDSADVTVSIPRRVVPVATKSWPEADSVAQSGEVTTVTLGVGNSSTGPVQLSELSVSDVTAATFDTHDVTNLGPVVRFPAGADRVTAGVCIQPVGTPCTAAQFIQAPASAGPALSLPAGVTAAQVTGVQFRFSNSAGTPIPVSSTSGLVSFGLKLRDTTRSTGAVLDPVTSQTAQNCAVPTATDPVAGMVTGAQACTTFSVLPRAVSLTAGKQYFSDPTGGYVASGQAAAGTGAAVSALTTVTNTSQFAVPSVTITEPSQSTASNFAALDVTSLRLQFPAGAKSAQVQVTCRNGATPAAVTVTAPPTTANLSSTGCPVAGPPARISVTYRGTDAVTGDPTILPASVATLGVHGTLNSAAVVGQLSNCADAAISGPAAGRGSAAGVACANLTVVAPSTSVTATKTSSGSSSNGQLVPGRPLLFTLTGKNAGNLPQAAFTITDPPSPTAPGNPFDVVVLSSADLSSNVGGLSARFALQVYDSRTGAWVAYSATDAALLNAARGIRAVLQSGTVPAGATLTVHYTVLVRSGVALGAKLHNCQLTTASAGGVAAVPVSVCRTGDLTVVGPSASGSVQKSISPTTLPRAVDGVPPMSAQVRIKASNTGNVPLKRLVVTDADAGFFDNVTVSSLDVVNFPPGADRVQVDACTTGCAAGTYVTGVPATAAVLPAGVVAADVQGLRWTFTKSSGGYVLNPGSNFPTSGGCPNSTVCFRVAPRLHPRSSPVTGVVPGSLSNTAGAAGESELQPAGSTLDFGTATATLTLVQGVPKLDVSKTPTSSTAGPGNPIPFDLSVRNVGTASLADLVISDPVPTGLTFDDSYAGAGGKPYTVTVTVPAGTPALADPTFTLTRGAPGDPDRITSLNWSFAGSQVLPGTRVVISYQARLAAGYPAGQTVINTFGAGTSNAADQAVLTCATGDPRIVNGPFGAGPYCTASARVLTRGGADVDAQKWVTGNASLGFYNTVTDTAVQPGDVGCPILTSGGVQYTRYPCIAQVLAGEQFSYLLQVTNAGNTPVTEVRLADGLPHLGDTGVKLTDEARGTDWSDRPVLSGPPTVQGSAVVAFSYTSDPTVCTANLTAAVAGSACPSGAWTSAYSPGALGFQAIATFPAQLAPGASFTITVRMQAPATLSNPVDSMPIAWNSFAHSDFVLEPGARTPSHLPMVEPPKVGVGLPFGALQIAKLVTGRAVGAPPVGPFQAAYRCTVTPVGGTATVVAQGTGPFNLGAPLIVAGIPVGARCSVWEPNSGGGISDHPDELSALVIDIAGPAGARTTATVTNRFSSPPTTSPAPSTTPGVTPTTSPVSSIDATITPTQSSSPVQSSPVRSSPAQSSPGVALNPPPPPASSASSPSSAAIDATTAPSDSPQSSGLAFTGAVVGPLVLVGFCCVLGGGAVLLMLRRKPRRW